MSAKESPLTLRLESKLSDPPPKWKFPEEPLPPKKPTIPPKKMPNIPTPEPPLTFQRKNRVETSYSAPHSGELYQDGEAMFDEINVAIAPHIDYRVEYITDSGILVVPNVRFGNNYYDLNRIVVDTFIRSDREYVLHDLDPAKRTRLGGQLAFGAEKLMKSICTQEITPVEYAEYVRALAKSKLAKKSNSKHKSKSDSRLSRELIDFKRGIALYNLREHIRTSPELQAIIKKIINAHAHKAFVTITSPSKSLIAEQELEECEARAERYRKALHISVGIPPKASVKAGGKRRTVKRRTVKRHTVKRRRTLVSKK